MNVVITGASSGIGKAIGAYLSQQGHRVIGTSRKPSGSAGPIELMPLDVTDDASVEAFGQAVFLKMGKVDVLINTAGYSLAGPLESTSMAECIALFDTNYFGVVRVTRQFLPHFRAHRSGLIINTSSLGGLMGMPFQAHYSASKFALEGYTEALRMELAPYNVQVCNINPGDFNTAFAANRRLTAVVAPDYQAKLDQFLQMYEQEENNGADPIQIARLVAAIIQKKRPRVRYLVGKPSQTMGVFMKRLFGATLFEKVMMAMWKVK